MRDEIDAFRRLHASRGYEALCHHEVHLVALAAERSRLSETLRENVLHGVTQYL